MLSRAMIASAVLWALLAGSEEARGDLLLASATNRELYLIDTTAGTVTLVGSHTLLTNGEAYLGGMALAASGTLYGMSLTSAARLYTVDQTTGAVTGIGPLNSAFVFEGGASLEPATGVLFAVNMGSASSATLITIDTITGQAAAVGQIGSGGHDFGGISFHPSGNLYGVDRVTNALWKIDPVSPAGAGTAQIGNFTGGLSMGLTGGLTCNLLTGTLYGYAEGSHAIFTVDPATGVGTTILTLGSNVPQLASLVLLDPCPGHALGYGAGCAGTGGFVPKLALEGCPTPGGLLNVRVTQALGGTQAFFLFGLQQGSLPMSSGCSLLVTPLLAPFFAVPVGGSGPGSGSVVLAGQIPASLPTPVGFTMQTFTTDPGGPAGFANSNGVDVTVDS